MVGDGDASGVEGGGRDGAGTSSGDDGRFRLLQEPLDGLPVGLMA